MLESYVTPILMSYVNRYIKNLKPSDLQLSLWGGDVVLSKLELKLDVLEQELKLPFTFLSGHIHELRIHVPWTKLGSEPVVITINTMECILKLKDGAQRTAKTHRLSVSITSLIFNPCIEERRYLDNSLPSKRLASQFICHSVLGAEKLGVFLRRLRSTYGELFVLCIFGCMALSP
ncbi:vacuolar protein sorting-associated protein 13B-like [Apteryx rowi]|uniref:vacuolar protein sorting-associated protein 13B-like n=1 Tax=Apteryx rowi TaxID=308060 RepID=UPI000E1DE5CC|nr:vacuolar protein sorting-associated protein 13B-like [Apteryx rowi]